MFCHIQNVELLNAIVFFVEMLSFYAVHKRLIGKMLDCLVMDTDCFKTVAKESHSGILI